MSGGTRDAIVSERISIAALRESIANVRAQRTHPAFSAGGLLLSDDVILAFVDAVEAARGVADLPTAIVNSGAHERLRKLLARFDFGEPS